ncbi:cytochrome P450 [Streptosporangium sp. NBC_01755]|uniref:cytochrome P450 n=1 Tax=unclassified Streptosporangium TaxID=2632669 RepID=UPI002DD8152B|nr:MULTISPECIES: cytochrome P450 [unclassified Streptosporangium]WSA25613.1 cytochrome P450 [Streptosporangium sp. NBC_01810]WSD02999.1 cytochrome P450 [Streptosporangium sp. NBC_01755]
MTSIRQDAAALPTSDIDPFDHENLRDRTPMQIALREAGPVVYLNRYDVYALGRYDEVGAAMVDWQHFQVGAGVGLANFHTEKPWRLPAMPTESDPPLHDAPRRVLSKILSPRVLRRVREQWTADAEELVERLVAAGGEFDAMPALAAAFPLKVFPDAVGLPKEGREDLLAYGDLVFNAFGPKNDLFTRSANRLAELSAWVTTLCAREVLAEGGFGAEIWAAADRGDLTQQQAPLVVRSLLSAGVDTTVHGIAAILHAFATHPEQWQRLREQPQLARVAFDEAVRWASPLQMVFHTTATETAFADATIPKHKKILMLLGAANRDPRRWHNPDAFDLTRDPSGHLGFGMGIHQCVGQHVARLEAEVLLTVLARRIKQIEPAAPPRRGLNNTLQTWESLPIRVST